MEVWAQKGVRSRDPFPPRGLEPVVKGVEGEGRWPVDWTIHSLRSSRASQRRGWQWEAFRAIDSASGGAVVGADDRRRY